jgi:hypothetical protein
MNRLYRVTAQMKDGTVYTYELPSFNAFDCIEEWMSENEDLCEDTQKLSVEFVRQCA